MDENIKNKVIKKFEEVNENKYLDLSNLDLDEIIFSDENNKIECFIRKQDEQFNLSLQNNFYDIIYLFINDNKLNNINLNFNIFAKLKVIDISDNNNLEEINYLPPNLEELVCNNCQLVKICSHDTIKKIHCMDNKISQLNNYPLLEDLKCDNNKLDFIPSMLKLKRLTCANNITLFKIDYQPNLQILDCSLTALEGKITFAPMITNLICHDTKISDVSELNEVAEIEFYDSEIRYLPFLPRLKSIIFNDKNIKLSPNYKIKKFLEYGNKIDIVFE
jgi:hypothetical protein